VSPGGATIGLLVGKFSPLHLGHEWCVTQAQRQCEHLVLLSWSEPELPGCEAHRRRRWLADRFPGVEAHVLDADSATAPLPPNDAPDEQHRGFVADWCRQQRLEVDVVFSSEAYGEGFAVHLGAALRRPVRHVLLDASRLNVPVSGTSIRRDVHANRRWLSPNVYADFVERIGLVGGESTGKSTLAIALARALETEVVLEYGRELWMVRGGALMFDDMLAIARRQLANEIRSARQSYRYLVCDTTPLVTLFYCLDLFGHADPELWSLAQTAYSYVFLCADDFGFVQDGTRRDAAFRARQNEWYRQSLYERGVAFTELRGSLEERLEHALRCLSSRPALE